jgi:hypothetical protein
VTLAEHLELAKREYIVALLTKHQGKILRAAKEAGRNRTQFYDTLADLNIDPNDYRPPHKQWRRGSWDRPIPGLQPMNRETLNTRTT